MRRFILLICSLCIFLNALSQEENTFRVTPTGRLLIDGALYASPEKELFKDGMAIPEARLGAKFFYGNWSSWIDVGIAYGKIGLRNMWIQYDFDAKNSIRVGNSLQPFGYQAVTTANVKPTFEQPLASALFNPGLQLGIIYTFKNASFYSSSSFHVESDALTNAMNYPQFNQQGYSLLTRFVWRSKYFGQENKPILQGGISFGFSSPEKHLIGNNDVHDAFTNSANFPTKVSNETAISATVDNAKNRFRFTPELLLAYKKLALESQYFFQTIARRDNLSSLNAQSFYVNLRGVLIGKNYGYDAIQAVLANPSKNSLELVADYNFSDFSKYNAGKANSASLTLNYYFNAYLTARLNYTYTKVSDIKNRADGITKLSQNAFQLRLMVLF